MKDVVVIQAKRFSSRLVGCEAGGALVEFALAVPILLGLAIGAVDFGLAYQQKHRLVSAAQAGAQLAAQERSVREVKLADIEARVRLEAGDTGNVLTVTPQYFCVCPEGGADFACDADPTPCLPGNSRPPIKYVQVEVRHDVDLIFEYPGVAATIPVRAATTMRVRW